MMFCFESWAVFSLFTLFSCHHSDTSLSLFHLSKELDSRTWEAFRCFLPKLNLASLFLNVTCCAPSVFTFPPSSEYSQLVSVFKGGFLSKTKDSAIIHFGFLPWFFKPFDVLMFWCSPVHYFFIRMKQIVDLATPKLCVTSLKYLLYHQFITWTDILDLSSQTADKCPSHLKQTPHLLSTSFVLE